MSSLASPPPAKDRPSWSPAAPASTATSRSTPAAASSKGHPIGATGIAQICESTWQLRGDAGPRQVERARVALTQNGGGWLEGDSAAMAVHILTAD
jgi:hypothetical protein